MPHAEHCIFAYRAQEYREDSALVSLLADKVTVLPGRVAVLMDPRPDTFVGSEILVPGGSLDGKYRDDAGTVIGSGVTTLATGDRVLLKPYDGFWQSDKDQEWIPTGREIRFFGVSSEWHDSIVARMT